MQCSFSFQVSVKSVFGHTASFVGEFEIFTYIGEETSEISTFLSLLAYFYIFVTEVVLSTETSVNFYLTTERHIPEGAGNTQLRSLDSDKD
jgi:hypothetical protein